MITSSHKNKLFGGGSVLLCFIAVLLLVEYEFVEAVKKIRFVSPLQSLTIWDPEVTEAEREATPRNRFLPKYKVSLKAESEARKKLASKEREELQISATKGGDDGDWSKQAATADYRRRKNEEKYIPQMVDKAVEDYEKKTSLSKIQLPPKIKNNNQYQFVGVIDYKGQKQQQASESEPQTAESPPIKWYARKKPKGAKWSVRLVHVDKEAVITDLFRRGKVDIFAKYENTGKRDEQTGLPVVARKCIVKERSLRTLYNFSLKHYFTDSSGMYWRERRLKSGIYTDGNTVYESSYRYRDGRNGMHRFSSFQQYLDSKTINNKQKQKILKKIQKSSPDVVVEE